MPLFDFVCPTCGHREEKLVKLDTTVPCPECRQDMDREMGRPAFKFANGQGTGMGLMMSIATKTPQQ